MKKVLLLAAVGEAATGLALLVSPVVVVRLLLGADLAGLAGRDDLAAAGIIIGRVLGIALIALGIACWPGRTALCGMLTYSLLATGYLAWLGIRGEWVGSLLWPAAVLHAVITVFLGRDWLMTTETSARNNHASE